MKFAFLLLFAMGSTSLSAQATEFRQAQLTDGGSALSITQLDGSTFNAPKVDGQDGFASPQVSKNHRYVGWLALDGGHGASYSQPLDLVVMDEAKRLHRFSGSFGMVLGWCFAEKGDSVVYRFAFPHGLTPTSFEMRRIKDGRLLREFRLLEDESQAGGADVPAWGKCAQTSAVAQ